MILCNGGPRFGLEPTPSRLPRKTQSKEISNSWDTEAQLAQMEGKEVLPPTPEGPVTGLNGQESFESTGGRRSLWGGIDLPIFVKGGLGVESS